jgi:hypothetical protein
MPKLLIMQIKSKEEIRMLILIRLKSAKSSLLRREKIAISSSLKEETFH